MLLEVPLIVEVEREPGKPVRIDAFTLVVNAHGGLMEMGIPLRPGIKMLLRQAASGLPKSAKVVGFRSSQDTDGFLIAFEFDSATPKFWPIEFPPEDWELRRS